MLKRVLCGLLLAAVLLCTAACGEGETSQTSSAPVGESSAESVPGEESLPPADPYLDEDGRYMPLAGVTDEYRGETFTILVVGESAGTYQSDDFTTTAGQGGIDYGDAFYGEVKARNDWVEEIYGVTLEVRKENNYYAAAQEAAVSGTDVPDAVLLMVDSMTALARDGYLCDLYALEAFDAEAPWWDDSANAAYSVGNKLFFTTGDITIMNKANTMCVAFNKEMVAANGLEDPYVLFENGNWTFDKMTEMAKAVSNATATSVWSDPEVIYGMVETHGNIFQYYGGSGMTLCEKDTADLPVLAFGDEASVTVTEKILNELNGATYAIYAEKCTGGTNIWNDSFAIFYNGRALFRASGFTAITKLRTLATMEFGILPPPKMTDTQDGYYTSTDGTFAAGILKNCEDTAFSAYMLDVFAAGAKNYITDAYMEVNLKWKSLRDDESEAILEYIFDNIIYDVGLVYNFGGIYSMFGDLSRQGKADVVSAFDKIESSVNSDIKDVIESYRES